MIKNAQTEIIAWYMLDANGEKTPIRYDRVSLGFARPSRCIIVGSQDDSDVKELGRPRWWSTAAG